MKTKDMEDFLVRYIYENNSVKYVCPRFMCGGYAEMDTMAVTKTDYMIEYELKVSRQDFLKEKKAFNQVKTADKQKKIKHKYMKEIFKTKKHRTYRTKIKSVANKYYIVCPKNLISLDEIPEYSGLIYIDECKKLIMIRKAPFIHKKKISVKIIERVAKTLLERILYNGLSRFTFEVNEKKNNK